VYLLKGIYELNRIGIIHYDIKYDNIMYDDTLKAPIIIDYGLSIYTPELSPKNYRKEFFAFVAYSYWCIDIVMCSYIFQKIKYDNAKKTKITKHELETIYDAFISHEYGDQIHENAVFSFTIVSPNAAAEFREKYMAYFHTYIGKYWFELYEHLMKYSNTWDNYSLSVVYLTELDELYRKYPKMYEKISAIPKYKKLLDTIVFSMPNERPTTLDTISQVKKLG
jgi:serine/threonine protein kinase